MTVLIQVHHEHHDLKIYFLNLYFFNTDFSFIIQNIHMKLFEYIQTYFSREVFLRILI